MNNLEDAGTVRRGRRLWEPLLRKKRQAMAARLLALGKVRDTATSGEAQAVADGPEATKPSRRLAVPRHKHPPLLHRHFRDKNPQPHLHPGDKQVQLDPNHRQGRRKQGGMAVRLLILQHPTRRTLGFMLNSVPFIPVEAEAQTVNRLLIAANNSHPPLLLHHLHD